MNLLQVYDGIESTLYLLDDYTLLYLYFALRSGCMAQVFCYKELIRRGVNIYG